MVKLFGVTDTIYDSNGDVVINATRARVTKEDNGDFYLELECGLEYANDITAGRQVVVPTPQGEQAFRLRQVVKNKNKIIAKAWHVFYDSQNYLIEDSYVVNKNANDALDHLNNSTDNISPFTTISDVPTVNSYRCVRTSLADAIATVVSRWGGHLTRDNWQIGLRTSIGSDNGVNIQYRKNLENIEASYDWEDVCTKLLPVGSDGITLEQVYVYSETQYDIPYTKCVTFSQDINPEDYESEDAYNLALQEDLLAQATAYVNAHFLPQVNYTLKATPERITDIGDTIVVSDERLGVDITTTVIAYTYDCILDHYKELQFGNFKPTLSGLTNAIQEQTQTAITESNTVLQATLTNELEEATASIKNQMSNSYVIYDGNQILIVDRLPKEDATYCILINDGGIGFSSTGINGTFNSAWTIDGTLNMQNINVINLTADLIKGGTLKLGSNLNEYGQLEVYDEANTLIAQLNKDGLKMYGQDGSYIVINNEVGFAGYDRLGNEIYWVSEDEFHQRKAVVEEEITLCNKLRFIAMEYYDANDELQNDGIGLVSVYDEGDANRPVNMMTYRQASNYTWAQLSNRNWG